MTDARSPKGHLLSSSRQPLLRVGLSLCMAAILAACGSDHDDDTQTGGDNVPPAARPVLNPARQPFVVQEASVRDFHAKLAQGEVSCEDLVSGYLARIEAYDKQGPTLNSVILVNPNALAQARALDAQYFGAGESAGPMHCVPVLMKDNVDTADMPTTAGSLALAANQPDDDAYLVAKVKAAGGIVLGKANLDEFAFGFGGASAIGGQAKNAYILENSPGGSSSGTGTAITASLAMIGVGTDTGGSIRVPSAVQGLYGLRPTLRLVSQDGIVPLAHGQDTAGPMCRQVEDCALLLDAMAGYDASPASGQRQAKAHDAPLVADAAAYAAMTQQPESYLTALSADSLRGARIGVVRAMFPTPTAQNQAFLDTLDAALAQMAAAGAVIEDVVIPDNRVVIGAQSADIPGNPGSFGSLSSYEFSADLSAYLSSWSSAADGHWRTTADVAAALAAFPQEASVLRSFNSYLANGVALADSSSTVARAYQRNLTPRDEYVIPRVLAALDNQAFGSGVSQGQPYDVLVYPVLQGFNGSSVNAGSNNRLSPFSGFPALAFPAGYAQAASGPAVMQPVGLEMLGRPFSEARLLALGYGWQSVAAPRQAPTTVPAL